MASATEAPEAQAPVEDGGRRSGRRPLIVVVVVVLLLAGSVAAIRWSAESNRASMVSLLADQTTTKTYDELARQAALPSDARSADSLAQAIATPQADRTGAVWTTEVRATDLRGPMLLAEVVATLAEPMQAPSYYLDFVVAVPAQTDPSVVVTGKGCVVRTGDAGAPVATQKFWITSHLFLEPCTPDVLAQIGAV